MSRIVVLGCAGAGKTTFARRLGRRTGQPVIVLDEIWRPEWDDAHFEAFRALVREAHAGDAWVSDGNFAVLTFDIRLPRADLVIWVDRSRWLCALRAAARVFRPGESHRLADLPKVLAFVRNFDRVNRPRIEALRLAHGPTATVVRLTNDREAAAFLDAAATAES